VLSPEPCEAHTANASVDANSRLEVADILRRFGPSYAQTHSVSPFEQRLIDALIACRIASLGGQGWSNPRTTWSTALSVALSVRLTTRAAIGMVPNVRP
jgi:hypothetical protein